MLIVVIYVPGMPLAVLSAAVFLLGVGSSSLLLAFAVGREHSRSATSGRAIGIINMAVVGSGALFQPIIGILLDAQWSGRLLDGARVYSAGNFRLAMLVLPVAAAAGILALWRIKETYCRQRPDGISIE
jgi:MFS family permease